MYVFYFQMIYNKRSINLGYPQRNQERVTEFHFPRMSVAKFRTHVTTFFIRKRSKLYISKPTFLDFNTKPNQNLVFKIRFDYIFPTPHHLIFLTQYYPIAKKNIHKWYKRFE